MKLFMLFYDNGPARFLVFARDYAEARRLVLNHLQVSYPHIEFERVYDVPEYTGVARILQEIR